MAATGTLKRGLSERVRNWVGSFSDPLRSASAAERWIGALTITEPLQIQKEALELLAAFPDRSRSITPGQVEALLRLDARLEPVISQLTHQYTTSYQRSSSVETRLWHGVFDLVKAFVLAYQSGLKAFAAGDKNRLTPILPAILVRLAHYKGLDGKFRLFRYGHWIPAQWRELHELYEFGRARRWLREPLAFGSGTFAQPGVSLEQEYIKSLLLMRLDSGNFTPDQVEWISKHIDDWATPLTLEPPPAGSGATFFVDLSGTRGLRRHERPQLSGRLMYLDTGAVYARVVERMRWLPDQEDASASSDDLPPREQKLLLMRLAALFGPDALAFSPRSPRETADTDVRVVIGLQALTRAVAEVEQLPEEVRRSVAMHSYDEITQMVVPNANPDSVTQRIRGTQWRMVDRSESGCKLVAPVREAPTRLGELIAFRDPEGWSLAVVRRMQRQQVDEITCGVEVIARRMVRVLLRTWVSPVNAPAGASERPFFGLYLPAHSDNRQAFQRSLIGPDERFMPGGMIELDTGSARYLIRFTQTLERQAGWAWVLFNAVRKLSG